MAHEASDSPNKETDVHPQYGDNTSFNGENIHQGVGNNYNIKNVYQNNKSGKQSVAGINHAVDLK